MIFIPWLQAIILHKLAAKEVSLIEIAVKSMWPKQFHFFSLCYNGCIKISALYMYLELYKSKEILEAQTDK
jgi:hypothetical protein